MVWRSLREAFSHLHGALRLVAGGLAVAASGGAWTMSDHGEYAVALAAIPFVVLFAFIAVYGWSGIPQQLVITKIVKWIVRLGAIGWGILQSFIIYRNKGTKPWTNFTLHDVDTARSLLSLFIFVTWRWFLAIGAIVSAFLVGRWTKNKNQREQKNDEKAVGQQLVLSDDLRGCQDEWLHVKLKQDKAAIKDLVRLPGISYSPDYGKAHVDFVFSVFNNSLYDVVIENSVSGDIRYGEDNDAFYYPPKFLSDMPIGCASRSGAYFLIRQAIRAEEIPRFRDADDVLIWFHNLQINFRVTDESSEIPLTSLNTQYYLETKKGMWRNWDRLDFVFGYTNEQWAALQSGNVAHSIELAELRAKLKEKDKVALAPPEITAFKPYLEMVSKETSVGKYIKLGTDVIGHHSDIKSGAFLPVFLKPIDGTVGSVALSGDITLKGEDYEHRVEAVCWYGRDAATVPLRHNETQSLFIVLCDGKSLTTYEHQYKNRPLEQSISPSVVYGKVHLHIRYEKDRVLNLSWCVKIQKTDKDLTVDFIDEAVFDQAVSLS